MVTAGLTALFINAPFLNLPVLRQLITWSLQSFANWLYTHFKLFVDVTALRLENDAHQAAYDSASLRLKIVALDEGLGSPGYAQAVQAAQAALSQFTQFHSS